MSLRRRIDENESRASTVRNGFPAKAVDWFLHYGRSPRKHRMDLVLIFADHTVSGDGSNDIGQFVLAGGSTAQTVNVTGRRLTSASTRFTIAGFARARDLGIMGIA
jgi:hypothetical protein